MQVMESMRRQVERLALENERLQSELKEALSNAAAASSPHWRVDEDGDGMERAAQLSTLTMDVQRPSSATPKVHRKSQEATSLPSAQSAPLLQFTPGSTKLAPDKYSNDFDFSLNTRPQQPPIPPPFPIYNGEIMQAPYSATLLKQSSIKDNSQLRPCTAESLHASDSHLHHSPVVRVAEVEPALTFLPTASVQASASSHSAALRPKADWQPSASTTVVPAISVGIVKAAQVARPPSAGDRASDRSQNSERSVFSVSEANEGWVF
jgi:hypothetical protein